MTTVSIVYPAQDVAAVSAFLSERGFAKKFADGDKFAMLQSEGLRVMVAAGSERIVEQPSLAFQIGDQEAAALREQYPEAELTEGEHEHNFVIQDPSGNTVVFFVRKPQEQEEER